MPAASHHRFGKLLLDTAWWLQWQLRLQHSWQGTDARVQQYWDGQAQDCASLDTVSLHAAELGRYWTPLSYHRM